MSRKANQGTTRVKIYNQSYDLRGNDPEYIEQLADFVDQKMSDVSEFTPTVDTAKVAILAALNIADQYFESRDRLEELEKAIKQTEQNIVARLESDSEAESA